MTETTAQAELRERMLAEVRRHTHIHNAQAEQYLVDALLELVEGEREADFAALKAGYPWGNMKQSDRDLIEAVYRAARP